MEVLGGVQSAYHFMGHVGADADTALVEGIAISAANVNDSKVGTGALPKNAAVLAVALVEMGHDFLH